MKYLYIVIIKDTENKTPFNEYVLTSTTKHETCTRIVEVLNQSLSKRYEVFYQIEYI